MMMMSYMSSANDPDLMNTVIMNSLDDVDMEKPISQEDHIPHKSEIK